LFYDATHRGHAVIGNRMRFFNLNYSAFEKKQMRFVLHCFQVTGSQLNCIDPLRQQCIAQLAMDDHFKRPQHLVNDDVTFHYPYWSQRFKHQFLTAAAKDMVKNICAYQEEREQRFIFRRGYTDDPTNLVCELLKNWCVELSDYNPTETNLSNVQYMLRCIKKLQDPEIFPQGYFSQQTFLALLNQCQKLLAQRVLPQMQAEILQVTARDILMQFKVAADNMINAGMNYLYFILRDKSKVKRAFTPNNFLRSDAFQSERKGLMGVMLLHLLEVSSQQQAGCLMLTAEEKVAAESEENLPELIQQTNPFYANGHVSLLPKLEVSSSKRHWPYLAERFLKDKTVQMAFIKLHGILFEMMKFYTLIKQAYHLSGQGGDLLIYGIAVNKMQHLLQIFTFLQQELNHAVQVLEQAVKQEHDQLITSKKTDGVRMSHYRNSRVHVDEFTHSLQLCCKAMQQLQQQMQQVTLAERMAEAKQSTLNFFHSVEHFSKHLASQVGFEQYQMLEQHPYTTPIRYTSFSSALSGRERSESNSSWVPMQLLDRPAKIAGYPLSQLDAPQWIRAVAYAHPQASVNSENRRWSGWFGSAHKPR
jgi:hypothetical protein